MINVSPPIHHTEHQLFCFFKNLNDCIFLTSISIDEWPTYCFNGLFICIFNSLFSFQWGYPFWEVWLLFFLIRKVFNLLFPNIIFCKWKIAFSTNNCLSLIRFIILHKFTFTPSYNFKYLTKDKLSTCSFFISITNYQINYCFKWTNISHYHFRLTFTS